MHDTKILLEELKQQILQNNAPQKMTSSTKMPLMRRHYKQLAALISCVLEKTSLASEAQKLEMGVSISWATLERIFTNKYVIKERMDKRQLLTLNKLCIFIGFKNWESFCKKTSEKLDRQKKLNTPIMVVKNALKAEFEAYQNLPNIDLTDLQKYFVPNSLPYERIVLILHKNVERNWLITNDLNPSNYQILDIEIIKQEETKIEIQTRECWYLRWYNPATKLYTFIYNTLNKQLYILKRADKNSEWKVNLNYYESNNTEFVG